MSLAKVLVPLVAAGGALYLLFDSKPANASQPKPPGTTSPPSSSGTTPPPLTTPASSLPGAQVPAVPESVLTRVVAALATGDPKEMRRVADELDKEGWKAQAQDLRAAAAKIEQLNAAMGQTPATSSPSSPSTTLPPVVVTSPGLPPLTTPTSSSTPSFETRKALAAKAALEVKTKSKGRENKSVVLAYQKQEAGLPDGYGGKLDGNYGPATGLTLIKYGFVPPKPMYWGALGWTEKQLRDQKNAWKSRMHAEAMKDPPRADEWKKSGAVI